MSDHFGALFWQLEDGRLVLAGSFRFDKETLTRMHAAIERELAGLDVHGWPSGLAPAAFELTEGS